MLKNQFSILTCLNCDQQRLEIAANQATCENCGVQYPVLRGIIDFRNADRDLSSGYDLNEDNLLAAKINDVFDEARTYNELLKLLEGMRKRRAGGISLADIDPGVVLREDQIRPQPFTTSDAAHGSAILQKIPLYLEGTGLPALPRGIALEDGAGTGYFVDGLSKHFEHLFVLDLSMAYMMLVRKIVEERGLANVTLVCANVEHLPFMSEAFDFIHSNNVIEHVVRQELLISETHRVLKSNGLLFMLSPNRFSLYFEPHFRLPGFGFIPKPISRWVIRRRQNRDISDISLRSLREVRALARRSFGQNMKVAFIPRHLRETATGGRLRNFLVAALQTPFLVAR